MTTGENFIYLNRDDLWPDFESRGLERSEDGSLLLASLPSYEGLLRQEIRDLDAPELPAGMAAVPGRMIYYSVPEERKLRRFGGCLDGVETVPCSGSEDVQTPDYEPRGLLFHPTRKQLIVVDSGDDRLLVFDPHTFQLVDVWGETGSAAGQFDQPLTIAADSSGSVYVVDRGNRRVQKFNERGEDVPGFWEKMHSQIDLHDPLDVAVAAGGSGTLVYILDAGARKIVIADDEGGPVGSFELADAKGPLTKPLGLAAGTDALYVGDNQRRRIFKFTPGGELVGEALRYEGPVASLAITGDETLWVHTGSFHPPLSLVLRGGHVKYGLLWSKRAFTNPATREEQWHRIKCLCGPLPANTHLQVHHASTFPGPPPDPASTGAFTTPPWTSAPTDTSETLIEGTPGKNISVGVTFTGDGFTTPVLSNIRIDFEYETNLRHLPAIYQEEAASRKFLTRLLSLFESSYEDAEVQIDALDRMFDAAATRADLLPWLAGWVGLELPETWDDEKKREAIAEAFASYAVRGTPGGLRKALKTFAGVDAYIEEPIRNASLWSLPDAENADPELSEGSILGYTTMLAPAAPFGAALGSTAVVDQSYLTGGDDRGESLFFDVAHRFNVLVYQGRGYSEGTLAEAGAVVEREKPAHTSSHICVVEPHFRVGFQARLGVNSIVAGAPRPSRLSGSGSGAQGMVLGGEEPGRIGPGSRIGQTTRLNE